MKAALLALFLLSLAPQGAAAEARIGRAAPGWELTGWLNSPPLELEDLRGQVVLVRWWTAPECSYCRATAPALREFQAKYGKRGFQTIAIYHEKSSEALGPGEIADYAKQDGFDFPAATDPGWKTLKRWWLNGASRRWTSVSFLLDRKGIIRFIHPGGQYVRGDGDFETLERKIQELLAEPGG